MNNKIIDLNLFVVAESLYKTKNVSVTAKELGLSQPSVSHLLSKLRDYFQDPMFVRISRGVAPTTFALSKESEIKKFIDQAKALSQRQGSFVPSKATGRVTIASTDYFEVVMMPKLLSFLQRNAPGIQVSLRPTRGDLPTKELENGKIDFAVAGFYEKLPEGFYRAQVFKDDFSIALRKGHPEAKRKLSVEDLKKLNHVHITLAGDFEDDLKRNLKYGSYSFTGPAWLIVETDLVLIAPTRLLKAYQKYFPVEVRPCPLEIDPIQIQMVWHQMTHQDPMKKWFREQLKQI